MANARWTCNLWCSHPDSGADDCECGDGFDSRADIAAWLEEVDHSDMFAEIIAPSGERTIIEPKVAPQHSYDADRSEAAMEVGMAFGCDAYNDAMGWC